jgi:hypothetical protein
MSSVNNYIINGINTYGLGTTVAQIAEGGLSLTTLTDNFSMNGLGFLYNGLGATWADVRQKVEDLKAVVVPPDVTTLTVNNRIQVTNGTNTTTINPTSITSATFTGALVGNADTATTASTTNNVNNAAVTTGGPYGVAYMNNSAGTTFISTDTAGSHLTFNPSNNTLATRHLSLTGSVVALSAPNTTTVDFTSANVTATTFTGALAGNANTATNANTANIATNSTITADNTGSTFYPTFVSTTGTQGLKIDTGMSYVPSTDTLTVANVTGNASTSTSSNIATTAYNLNALNPITPQYTYPVATPSLVGWTQVITTTGWTFNSITKAYACNTTPLVAGIYIMRAYVYCGNSSFFSGNQLINLVASNNFITNNSTTGWLDPSNASPMGYMYARIGAVSGDSVNNAPFVVNNTGAGFYPYWAVAVFNSVQINPAGNGIPQMNFCRIA